MSRTRLTGLGLAILCIWPAGAGASVDVATSIFPISAIVREVGGEKVGITTIVQAGSDPHHSELTPSKARAVEEADVIFLIGGHFDGWILPGGIENADTSLVVEFYKAFRDSLIPLGDSFNPHFWLDPMFAREMTRIVSMALCTVDLANCDYYHERAGAFIDRLEFLNLTSQGRLLQTDLKAYVALHPAWSYFARRYGLREYGTIEISHEAEPSPRHVAELIVGMRREGIRYVLAEEFSNLELAMTVASHTGASVILLDPLGGEERADRDTYFKLIDHNIWVIEGVARD